MVNKIWRILSVVSIAIFLLGLLVSSINTLAQETPATQGNELLRRPDPCEGKNKASGPQFFDSISVDCSLRTVWGEAERNAAKNYSNDAYAAYLCRTIANSRPYLFVAKDRNIKCKVVTENGKKTGVPDVMNPEEVGLKSDSIVNPDAANNSPDLGRNYGCNTPTTSLTLTDILNITNYLPVIPQQCTTYQGLAIPINPSLIVHIIARMFGFIASAVFYLILAVIVFSGLQWIWSGVDNKSAENAKKNLYDATWAVVIILSTHLIISTLLGLIGGGEINTNLSDYFINKTNINQ